MTKKIVTLRSFTTLMRASRDKIIDAVVEQSEEIFEKPMTKEELVPMFNSNVKESPDREPKFRVKVDTDIDDLIKADVFDADKNPIRMRLLTVSMQEIRDMLLLNSIVCIS